LARKEQLLRTVSTATTSAEKAAVLLKAGIAPRNHSKYLSRYKKVVEVNTAASESDKLPRTAKRLSGGGRHTILTAEQELELREWVMDLRRKGARVAVSEKIVRFEAMKRFGITASHRWVNGWMKRQGLTIRLRTTYKEIATERM